jgi:hypothetical protein
MVGEGQPLHHREQPTRSPYTRQVFPRISSAVGFFFCGMIDEPVA